MGTTPGYAIRYAVSTDNVQLWDHFQNLATDVDNTLLTKLGVVARWTRTTPKSSLAGVETGIIRIDGIPLLGGVFYTIETNSLDGATVSGETGVVYARLNTSGAATTASAQLGYAQFNCNSGTTPRQGPVLVAEYAPVGNVTASVLLSVGRVGGSGTVTINGSATQPIVLMVKAWGKAPTPSGTDL